MTISVAAIILDVAQESTSQRMMMIEDTDEEHTDTLPEIKLPYAHAILPSLGASFF